MQQSTSWTKAAQQKCLNSFFEDSSGILVSDRFSAYKSLTELIKTAWCWVHVRRDFLAVFKGVKSTKHGRLDGCSELGNCLQLTTKGSNFSRRKKCSDSQWQKINEELVKPSGEISKEFKREISQNKLR
ncbi:MAG: transposase [Candidatus Obscuribacter sp.]|nr:transposase [Candidatus Obscuribacter sp.]